MNVKANSLAIVIKSASGNEGAIVHVGELLGHVGEFWIGPEEFTFQRDRGVCWAVTFPKGCKVLYFNLITKEKLGVQILPPGTVLPVPDAWLMPIDDPDLAEEINNEQELDIVKVRKLVDII